MVSVKYTYYYIDIVFLFWLVGDIILPWFATRRRTFSTINSSTILSSNFPSYSLSICSSFIFTSVRIIPWSFGFSFRTLFSFFTFPPITLIHTYQTWLLTLLMNLSISTHLKQAWAWFLTSWLLFSVPIIEIQADCFLFLCMLIIMYTCPQVI